MQHGTCTWYMGYPARMRSWYHDIYIYILRMRMHAHVHDHVHVHADRIEMYIHEKEKFQI